MAEGVGVGVGVGVAEAVTPGGSVCEAEGVLEGVPVPDAVLEGVSVPDAVLEGVGVLLAVPGRGVGVLLAVGVLLDDAELLGEGPGPMLQENSVAYVHEGPHACEVQPKVEGAGAGGEPASTTVQAASINFCEAVTVVALQVALPYRMAPPGDTSVGRHDPTASTYVSWKALEMGQAPGAAATTSVLVPRPAAVYMEGSGPVTQVCVQ